MVTGAMLIANVYLLCWDWDRWKHVLPYARSAQARHGDLVTSLGMLIAAGVGFQGITETHLARLRHESFTRPLALVAAGGLLGVAILVTAYRRAKRSEIVLDR